MELIPIKDGLIHRQSTPSPHSLQMMAVKGAQRQSRWLEAIPPLG
jgi:hypothetical protein